MSITSRLNMRVIAIAPTTRGFGFAVVDPDGKLVDWGAVGIRCDKNAKTLRKVCALIDLYRPDVLAIEDYAASLCARSRRVRALGKVLSELAKSSGVLFRTIPMAPVRQCLCIGQRATKHAVAMHLAEIFPRELGHLMPHKRETWMKEDHRMAVFDAVALAVASGHSLDKAQ